MSDDSDNEYIIEYLNDYPQLPASAPVGHPHLVDLISLNEEFPDKDMTIADLVVTILFKYKPEALKAFLDLERPEVHFSQRSKGSRLDFCIKRQDDIVKIGYLNEEELGGWDLLYTYRIDGEATGNWSPISAQFDDDYIVTEPQRILEGAPSMAFTISIHEPWGQGTGAEIEFVTGLWPNIGKL